MNGKDMLNAVGHVDADLIDRAENAAPGKFNLLVRITCKFKNRKGKKVAERFLLPAIRMEVEKCPEK